MEKEKMTRFGHSKFYELLDQMAEIHSAKNHDYAGTKDPLANLKCAERIDIEPWIGCWIRIQDKVSRVETFIRQGEYKVKDESVKDTLLDLAIYALLDYILYEERTQNET